MKSFAIIAIAATFFLGSCSTVYRSGQTPDDVYYSPAPEAAAGGTAYVPARTGRTAGKYNANQAYNSRGYSGYDDFATMDDRWLMMRVRNPYRWSMFDNYSFYSPFNSFYSPFAWGGGFHPGLSFGGGFYNPYGFSYYNHFNNYWNWNSYYNPYAPNIIIVNPKTNPAGYTKARSFNPSTYSNTGTVRRPAVAPRAVDNNNTLRPRYNNSNNYRATEQSNRRVNQNTQYRNNNETYRAPVQDRPVRTYTPSTNSSSGSGGAVPSSSGGGAGSRPSRR